MANNDGLPLADHDWILHTPYAEPTRHWKLDDHGRATTHTEPRRRPSSTQLPVPSPKGDETDWTPPDPEVEPHGTINEIRQHVRAWRAGLWRGVSPRVLHLLEYWAREGAMMRPFWCQREAAETLIWLFDAGRSQAPEAHAAILRRIEQTNSRWNAGIPRLALKMATGTGKTNLMAMIALWWAVRNPDGPVELLVLTPGLTIRDRLRVLSDHHSEVWDSVAPRGFQRDVNRMRWTIINFQAFQRQSVLDVGRKKASGKEKKLLYGPGHRPDLQSWRETAAEMLERLLKTHRGGNPIAVINDEAHHCYTLRGVALAGGTADDEEREERKRAELWFGAVRALQDGNRLAQVFDLSATPMWLRRPAALKAETFPWTVSDFSLIDAVESGLVKVPRVPVDDRMVEAEGQPAHLHPRYRNIYLHNQKRVIVEPLAPEVAEPLHQLYDHYAQDTLPAYAEKGHAPVMIVVANTIENATALHRYIAGYKDGPIWKPGHLHLFSNVDATTGAPKATPPTVLVHSRLDDVDDSHSGTIAKAITEQAELFATTAKTADGKRRAIRDVFMSVGRKSEPGEAIRCVISVGMLTEGWDARNVTHVFGYRAFGSQLLCEQVAGRALRKTAFTGADERQPIEYANLFGVPFAWPGGKTPGKPPVPVEPQDVYTVPGRERFRLRFPHVAGYAAGRTRPHWAIDPQEVAGCRVQSRHSLTSTVQGPLGGSIEIQRESDDRRTAVWKAAAQLVPKLDGGSEERRAAFLDSLLIISECLPHMKCTDWTDLQFDRDALDMIASHIKRTDSETCVSPVFDDQHEPGRARTSDTANVRFRTTLRYWHEAERSELNAAACHSSQEAELAAILDQHPDIAAWVRNFRLGWFVPWFNSDNASWARMEPDFVARATRLTPTGRDRFLIIEFKGLKAGEPSEIAKQKYLETRWAPTISRVSADSDDFGEWHPVWIEKIDHAGARITRACMGER